MVCVLPCGIDPVVFMLLQAARRKAASERKAIRKSLKMLEKGECEAVPYVEAGGEDKETS